jgi:hypothetical protein
MNWGQKRKNLLLAKIAANQILCVFGHKNVSNWQKKG